jgi:hypothetical protein
MQSKQCLSNARSRPNERELIESRNQAGQLPLIAALAKLHGQASRMQWQPPTIVQQVSYRTRRGRNEFRFAAAAAQTSETYSILLGDKLHSTPSSLQ